MTTESEHPITPELRALVADQCRAVAHMARALADVHDDLSKMFVGGPSDLILNMKGRQTFQLMNQLGDILNGMDAVTDEDEWTHPIFEKADALWGDAQTEAGEALS